MKKLYTVLALAMLLCGCTNKVGSITETTASETIAATTAEAETVSETLTETKEETSVTTAEVTNAAEDTVTTPPEDEFDENEKLMLRFMEYLQSGGKGYFEWSRLDHYDFMDDFTIDSYTYTRRNDVVYDITLTCSDSTCDMFPNGESQWVLNTNNYGNITFVPAERADTGYYGVQFDGDEKYIIPYNAAYDFTLYTGAFEADEEWFENYTDINVHGFYHASNPYVKMWEYDSENEEYIHYDVTPEEFATAVKTLYNVNITAKLASQMTDEDGFMTRMCGHGGSWLYHSPVSFTETDNEIKAVIDYYGDEFYFYPVVEVEYTFSKNEDGTITLQSAEKLFDKGYEVAGGSV
ncbi:MAG: hypothetical protein ACI4KG_04930 [Oscillospiraceae bacterium]